MKMASNQNAMHAEMPQFSIEERQKNLILNLCNFRAYGQCEIKIPMNNVTLINGPSGVGKTTIFEAFVFILYNGVQNPERFKTKKCWGWLFVGDYVIYRQKDPQLVKAWKIPLDVTSARHVIEYTQDDAQRLIDSIYGTLDIFLSCSYLRQKEFSAFLGGTDADKLAIMKTIALRGAELDEIKDPIKRKSAQLESECIGIRAQLDLSVRNIQAFDKQYPRIVQTQAPENPEEVIKKVHELRSQQETHDQNLKIAFQRETGAQLIKQQIDAIRTRKMQMEAQMPRIPIDQLKTKSEEVENKLKELAGTTFNPEKIAKAQIFKMWVAEDQRLETSLKALEKDLDAIVANLVKVFPDFPTKSAEALPYIEKKRSKLEEIRNNGNELRLMLNQSGITSLADGKSQLATLESDLTKAKDKESSIRTELDKARINNKMKCPSCQTVVIVASDGKHLEKCLDAPSAPIGLGSMLGSMQAEAKSVNPLTAVTASAASSVPATITHDDLAKAAATTASIASRRDRLQAALSEIELKTRNDTSDFPDPTVAINQLPTFTKYIEVYRNLEHVRDSRTRSQSVKPEEVSEKSVDLVAKSSMESELASLKKQYEMALTITRSVEMEEANLQQFTTMMTNFLNQPGETSMEIERKKTIVQAQIDQLLHLNTASELLAQRGILDKTMREKAEAAQNSERNYQAALRLLECAIKAERATLQTAVDEINVALSHILKRLFTIVPISVEISTTKQLKSKKDAVSQRFDIKIFYNNAEYSSAKQLSGGEKDRLSMAITLAMSQKFGSPFLFLDETLSSLNPELKSEAVTLLKEFAPGRTIVVIAHDETEGLFDRVIRIRSND